MPAIGGPNITEDGLVFAYDLGNTRSYKGEPTVNLLDGSTYQDIRNWGGYHQPEDITVLTETYKGSPVYRLANAAGVDPGVYTDKYLMANFPELTSLTVGDTYSFSFDFRVIQKSTVQNAGGSGNGAWVWYLTTANQIAFSDYDEEVWYRANIQATVNSTYDFAIPRIDFDNSIVDVCNFQFEKKPHATQFINGTRTPTESLLNLTGNNSIDLSNVSFDENAQMTFDGTDDTAYAIFDHGILKKDNQHGAWSIEAVFFYNGPSSNNECIIAGRQGHHSGLQIWGPTSRLYHAVKTNAGWTGAVNVWVDTLEIGKRYHTVMTYNNGRVESYLNGEHKATTVLDLNTYDMFDYSDTFHIGSISSRYNNIDLPVVKAYNKELSFEQVAQNYNSIKNRFNL